MACFVIEEVLIESLDELKFMSPKITAVLKQRCLMGDMKAIRLMYELTGQLKRGGRDNTVTAQNVQINQHYKND